MTNNSITYHTNKIQKILDSEPGQYDHNMVSLLLRDIAEKHGYEKANEVCIQFELDTYFNIYPVFLVKVLDMKTGEYILFKDREIVPLSQAKTFVRQRKQLYKESYFEYKLIRVTPKEVI